MVSGPGLIEILPVDSGFYFLPVYDPLVVFARPRAVAIGGITFGPRIAVGGAFAPWGWGRSGFAWAGHSLLVDGRPWLRTTVNHETYAHPYAAPRPSTGRHVEQHELRPTHPARKEDRKETRR